MPYATLNGAPVLAGEISMPLVGAWVAELSVDAQTAPVGAVTLLLAGGAVTFRGYASRSGTHRDATFVRIVGGNGGLATELEPQQYRNTPLRIPLTATLADCGETLSPTSDAAALAKMVPSWVRALGNGGAALSSLAEAASASWRVLGDGTVWVGAETWQPVEIEHTVLSEDPTSGAVEIACETPSVVPGVTFNGKHVSRVVHIIGDQLRTVVSFDGDGAADDVTVALKALVRHMTAHVDYHALYPAKVLAQNADGTLELDVDDDRFPGLSKVLIRYGVPGVTAKVVTGARVLVGFDAGNPQRPIATLWESGSVTELVIAGTAVKLGSSAAVDGLIKGTSYLSAESTFLAALLTYAGAIKSIADPTNVATTALTTAVTAFINASSTALSATTKTS